MKQARKRSIDWPEDFVPGTVNLFDFNSSELPTFVAGYLLMVRNCELDAKQNMHALLKLILLKVIRGVLGRPLWHVDVC